MTTSEYRRGVEDAIAALDGAIAKTSLVYLRKKLLTKKETKWVALYEGDEVPLWVERKLFDNKAEADKGFALCNNYRGAYPIEIEVPID